VYQIETYKVGGQSFAHKSSHEKIGFSTEQEKPVVCFGDANHRKSEITHAGLVV
jgi:hypothetical protein